jgi:HD superfamily phosphohydrolase
VSAIKKIFDPVHGFIKLNEIESSLVDSSVFQRLHYIRQLGVSYLVYPGATHTRFEHSLGVMQVASQIFDQISLKYSQAPIFEDFAYWRQVIRIAALTHDLGHLPFSHVAEKRLLGLCGHEAWTLKVLESDLLSEVWDMLAIAYPGRPARSDVIKVSIGEGKLKELQHPLSVESFTDWEQVMTQVITGDFFGADRIEYLLRDSRCTGLSYGLFDYHQLIEMLRILPGKGSSKLVLGIEENGIESCEALVLARHFMHKRVYQYPSVKAYGFHMSRFMHYLYEKESPLESLETYLSYTDNTILVAAAQELHKGEAAHPDSLALFDRSLRYRAVQLETNNESVLEKFILLKGLSSGYVEWCSQEKSARRSCSFPVLRKSGDIIDATECSHLLVIPSYASWVYLPSDHIQSFHEFMSQKLTNQDVASV